MKFTLSWLKDHLETDASLDEITDTLTMIGLEVEEVRNPAEALAPFIVAEVTACEPHPDADRLQVCTVNAGEGAPIQVVCGAPNAHAGMKGVFAPAGTVIPGSGLELKITKIRGVESSGMLCSERELELSDAHEGVIELPDTASVGAPVAEIMGLDDPMIEIAITPDRADCLGVHGVARDLAAAGLGRLKPGAVEPVKGAYESPINIFLDFEAGKENACPGFAGRLIRGLTNGPSPDWLQKRLTAIGFRPINALVDITNYISYDRARPLHVYDATKLSGDIGARLARQGEDLKALDDNTYKLEAEMCVIADDSGVLGLAGVMGGEESGSTSSTVDVFIESATFDPVRTAMTGRKLSIESDARYRFERGVDPAFVVPGLELATRMILDLCGGEPSDVVIAGGAAETPAEYDLDPALVPRLTGVDIPESESVRILESLGFRVELLDGVLRTAVPSWRRDVHGPADLVEEVIRIHGLDNIPLVPLPREVPGKRHGAVAEPVLTTRQRRARTAKRSLAGRGMVEAVTYSFVPRDHAEVFGADIDSMELANPISSEQSVMRPSLLPSLVAAAQRNADRGFADVALFEVGPQYAGLAPEDQATVAAGVRRGTAVLAGAGRHWLDASPSVDAFGAKADVFAVLAECGARISSVQITADAPDWYHPGRSGVVRLGPKNVLAYFGEIHPRVLDVLDAKGPMVCFEVMLDKLPEAKARSTRSRPPLEASDLQPVHRDFSFVVDDSVRSDDVVRAVRGAAKALIVDIMVFDLFEGASIGPGKKSVAIDVVLQPSEKTLTDAEIDSVAEKLIAAVNKATGGMLRV